MSKHTHIKNLFSAEEEDCLSLEQMKAYQAGDLVGDARHAAERHLLNCELCGMAYEGITELDSATVEEGAAAIAGAAWARIGREEKKRRAGAWVWISAAASIALIITVGFLATRNPSPQQQMENLAKNLYKSPPPPSQAKPSASDKQATAMGNSSDTLSIAMSGKIQSPEEKAAPPSMTGAPESEIAIFEYEEVVEEVVGLDDEVAMDIEPEESVNEAKMDYGETAINSNFRANTAKSKMNQQSTDGFTSNGWQSPSSDIAAPKSKERFETSLHKDQEEEKIADTKEKSELGLEWDRLADTDADDVDMAEKGKMTATKSEPKLNIVLEDDEVTAVNKTESLEQLSSVTIASKSIRQVEVGNLNTSSRNKGKRKSKARKKEFKSTEKQEAVPTPTPSAPDLTGHRQKTDSLSPPSLYDQGLAAYREADYARSSDLLRQAAAATPANLSAHYYAAASFMNLDQPQAAIYHLNRVLANPGHTHFQDAEWYKSLAYLKLGEREKAKKLLEKIEQDGGKHSGGARKALKKL